MSRESALKGLEAPSIESIGESLYKPTDQDRRLKIEFQLLTEGNAMLDVRNLPIGEAERILKKKLPNKDKPGFAAWFLNKDENRQRIEYLWQLSLAAAEDILLNTDPKAQSARVNLIKAMADIAGKLPGRQSSGGDLSPQKLFKGIENMDKAQLELLLEKNGASVRLSANKEEVLDVTPIEQSP
jgi:hypothetical protein